MKLPLFVLALALGPAVKAAETPPAPPARPPACTAPEHRQFDFWVGRWDVFDTKTGAPAGASLIESLYGGCAIRENWSEPGYTGGSLNHYDEAAHQWRQIWTDSSGAWREFDGGLQDGKLVMVWIHPSARFPGKTAHERITFSRNPDGTVHQYSDATIDEGKTWVLRYDYTYRPARSAP